MFLAVSIDYVDTVSAGDVERTNTGLELSITQKFPVVKPLFTGVQSAADHHDKVERTKDAPAEES